MNAQTQEAPQSITALRARRAAVNHPWEAAQRAIEAGRDAAFAEWMATASREDVGSRGAIFTAAFEAGVKWTMAQLEGEE